MSLLQCLCDFCNFGLLSGNAKVPSVPLFQKFLGYCIALSVLDFNDYWIFSNDWTRLGISIILSFHR